MDKEALALHLNLIHSYFYNTEILLGLDIMIWICVEDVEIQTHNLTSQVALIQIISASLLLCLGWNVWMKETSKKKITGVEEAEISLHLLVDLLPLGEGIGGYVEILKECGGVIELTLWDRIRLNMPPEPHVRLSVNLI
tara:strand:- start:45520 stop:45936 length:417 start_codon:yes stop_codon:yes gene_type:complete